MIEGHTVALAGGVGGAKLAHGLAALVRRQLTVIVNTGDDFEHLGLPICPDVDTVLYTLAGIANRKQGWGLENESWAFLDQLKRLGGPDWFMLGDRDLALHVLRAVRLRAGDSLTAIVADVARSLAVEATVLPMSDQPVRTMVATDEGELAFQDYFVRLRCAPQVRGFRFAGAEQARPTAEVLRALSRDDLAAVVICPSNPYVSIGPILAVPGLEAALGAVRVPVIAVSPIIGGTAVKGPAAKMMAELGEDVSALGVARRYRGLIDGLVIDRVDAGLAAGMEALGMRVHLTDALMRDEQDRRRLASACLAFAGTLMSGAA